MFWIVTKGERILKVGEGHTSEVHTYQLRASKSTMSLKNDPCGEDLKICDLHTNLNYAIEACLLFATITKFLFSNTYF